MKRVTKSVTALLLALVLSLTLLPAQALAADTAPATQTYTGTAYVGAHTNPVYARVWKGVAETSLQTAPSAQTAVAAQAVDYLTETEAVAALRKQMVARKETMTLNVKLPSGTDIEEAVTGIWDKAMEHVSGSGTTGDYLHWQHSGYDCPPVDYWDDDTNITFTVTFQRHPKTSAIWFTTAAQEAALTNYIRNTVLPQLSLSGKTTYQKVQAIYNWITANVKYDYSHLSDPTYLTQYTAYAAAVQKKAVCQGYANLFYRLANDAGVDCRIITGKAYNGTQTEDHAWNIVRMEDEKYYCLDATWDAGLKPENYEYFLKGLTSFSRDHQAETDKLNTPYWTQYQSRTSATDYKASSGPAAPTVTGGNDSQGRPTLKWNAVSGAAKYEVYRARSKDGDYIKYATVTGTSYTNTSYIENGNTYYYKVRALDANGTAGAWSSIVSVTYKQTLPAPTVTGGNDSQGRPTLKWKAVSGAAKYEVYRARSLNGDYIKYSTVTGTSYTNTSYIENGNTYYYKVRALKSDGTAGAWSSVVSVTYKQTLPAPTVTGGNDAQGRPTLTWNAVSGAAKYEVYRARSKDGTYTKYSTTTGTAYTNSSYLTSGATYYYKVRALGANGNAGPYSAVVSVTCRLKLTAPSVTGGTDAQGRPTLKWNAVSGAAKYEVYRARSMNGDYIKYSTVTGTSYTNTSYLANGTTYYYKVRALGSDGSYGPYSTPVSVTYKAPFGAPLVTGSKDSQGRPALKWDKVTDAAKYEVYRARSKDGTYSLMSTQSATGYTNTSYLANGTTYYYKVRALKANGTASAYSSVVTITYGTVPTPAAPTMRSAKADSAGITVSWDTAANAVTYNVYRTADAGSSWTQVASSVKGSSYKDTTVQKGVKYGYKVRGVAADGKTLGPMSPTGVTAKVTAASTTPDYVKLTSARRVTGGIQLTWESAADAKTYNVYRKVDGASGWTLLASSVSGTSYTDWNVEPGVRYTYTVRGVAADGQTLSKTYNKTGVTVFATINSNNVASDSLLLKPSVNIPSSLTRMNWDYIGLYYYHGQTINAGLDDFGGMLRLLFNSDGTVYLVSGNGTSRGVYYANDSVISIMFPDDETPQVYMVTFMRTEKYTYLHLMPDASGREALVFSAGSYR